MISRREIIAAGVSGIALGSIGSPARAFLALSAAGPDSTPLLPSHPESIKRFMGLRYGAFLHCSPAALSGKEVSWSREVETPSLEYDNLYRRFNPIEFDAEVWVQMLKDSGFHYITFITKHHDGFAMWNTKTTDYSVMNTPFGRDVLKEISVACNKLNMPLCLYYSIADFYQPDCVGASSANGLYLGPPGYALPPARKPSYARYVEYMKAQLKELARNYGPIVAWWFDGGWQPQWTYERGVDLLKYMRSLQPDTLTDQRVGCAYNGRVYMPTWFPTDRGHVGDFAVLEVDTPRFNRDIPWEYTTPVNGRSYSWTPGPYGDPNTWIDNLVKSACGDGNYILGLVTPSSGRFDPALVDKLGEAGLWLRRYGKSVYETRGGPYKRTSLYGSTCRGNQIYVHIFDSAVTNLVLPGLPKKVVGCSMLNGGQATVSQSSEAVTLNVSPNDVESPTTIVVLELDGSAEQITPIGEIPLNRGVEVRTSNENPSADRSASDGNLHTFWKSDGKSKRPWLEYDLVSAKSISRAILFEGEYEGELANIHRYQIEVKIGDAWKQVADVTPWGFEKGQETDFDTWPLSVFHPEIRFAPVSAQHVRLTIIRFTDTPVIHEFELYER